MLRAYTTFAEKLCDVTIKPKNARTFTTPKEGFCLIDDTNE
jgi:hypothetical protein